MSVAETNSPMTEFVARLPRLSKGELAVLRRAAGKQLARAGHSAQAVFYRTLPNEVKFSHEELYFLVATLYGLHPHQGTFEGNLGATLRRLAAPGTDVPRSLQLRLARLVEAEMAYVDGGYQVEEMSYRLRQVIKLAEGRRIGVNYERLLQDLLHWNWPSRSVQRQWTREFFTTDRVEPATKEDANYAD